MTRDAMHRIVCDRLTLEPQCGEHAIELFEVLSDPALYEHENEPPESLEWLTQRLRKLESRRSADGTEQWLNWVIRLPDSELVGYVQATVHATGEASIAYVLGSPHWGRGLAGQAVEAMMADLASRYGVQVYYAILKASNLRSLRLLLRLGFRQVAADVHPTDDLEADEVLMTKAAAPPRAGPSRPE